MNLKHLTDETLLKDIKRLIQTERILLTQVLFHLREIDRRKLYADLNYSSLYEYCIKELRYTEASAHRRITAARLLGEIPELEKKISSGQLTLSNIADVAKVIRENAIKETAEKEKLLNAVEGLSHRDCEKRLNELTGLHKKPMTTIFLYHETYLKLERVKHLTGKKSADEIVSFMTDVTSEKIEKEKFKINAPLPPAPEVKRKMPSGLKGAIYRRDKACVNCGSVQNLNYDHRIPYALGGKTSLENMRLLCSSCNQRARIRMNLSAPPRT